MWRAHHLHVHLKSLGSRNELTAQRILWRALEDTEWNVCPQVGLQNVLTKDEWLSPDEFSLYRSGSFDFLITTADGLPIFAVEVDGFGHDDQRQVNRDLIKNAFCQRAGLPLLRIGLDALEEREETSLLEWLCTAFAAAEREDELVDEEVDDLEGLDDDSADEDALTGDVFGEPGIEYEHAFPDNERVTSRLLERYGIGLGETGPIVIAPSGARYILKIAWPGRQPPHRVGPVSEYVLSEREFLVVDRERPEILRFSGVGRAEFAWAHKMAGMSEDQNQLAPVDFPWDSLGVAMQLAEADALRQVEAWAETELSKQPRA